MSEDKMAVKGSASMWALSNHKQIVQLTVPPVAKDGSSAPLRVEFDRSSLEATLSMLVQMHFEMMRTAPTEVPYTKH
jgi:hypothetical protein